MKIEEIIYQHRRDFEAIYVCEECKHTHKGRGYDDANFHNNVIPAMRCKKCGKNSAECGAEYRALAPKYPEGFQI